MKPPSDLPGAVGATLVISLKIALQTLVVLTVLKLTAVLPFVPTFDFHIRSSQTDVESMSEQSIKDLGKRLSKEGYGPAPPPVDWPLTPDEEIWDSEKDTLELPDRPDDSPLPNRKPSLNAKPPVVEIRSSFTAIE